MVYIYKKKIGAKEYYYLRASVKSKGRTLTKDIAYLGNDLTKVQKKLENLTNYRDEIRKAYKKINMFLESNYYQNKILEKKLKQDPLLKELNNVEAIRLHWGSIFQKQDVLTKKEIYKHFVVEFAFNSTSIEGNTITLEQAHKLIINNLTPRNKSLREIHDLKNTDKVFFSMLSKKKRLSHSFIINLHENLMKNIDSRTGYRIQDVRVFRMNFKSSPHPFVKDDMNIILKWYHKHKKKLHPLVLDLVFHHKFEKVHPFMDGNGRTGRMLMNHILMSKGYPPVIIRRKNRIRYLNSLNKADKTSLNKIDSTYLDLIDFAANEYGLYWRIFL